MEALGDGGAGCRRRRGIRALREWILSGPAAGLEDTDPNLFLAVSRLRAEWLVRSWKPFFSQNATPPRPSPPPVASPPLLNPKMVRREKLTISVYAQDLATVKEVRRALEDAGVRRVAESEVARMGFEALRNNKPDWMRLYRAISPDALRRVPSSPAKPS